MSKIAKWRKNEKLYNKWPNSTKKTMTTISMNTLVETRNITLFQVSEHHIRTSLIEQFTGAASLYSLLSLFQINWCLRFFHRDLKKQLFQHNSIYIDIFNYGN